jgi:hypothetical protein
VKNLEKFPENNLFVWALLYNRLELAKIFWKTGEFQTVTALFASTLLKKMAVRLPDLEDELTEASNYYENTACSVLALFDNDCDDEQNCDILMQKVPYYTDLDSLEMASQGKCLKFISRSCVQKLITSEWDGDIATNRGILGTFKVYFVLI